LPSSYGGSSSKSKQQHESTPSITAELLSDPDSDLARFLFIRKQQQSQDNNEECYEDTTYESIKSNLCWSYCLALEPNMSVRSNRIVAIFEAFAIFAALFLAGTWVLYEWGSGLAYGGSLEGDDKYRIDTIMSRVFEPLLAISIALNIQLAFFGGISWIMSLNFSYSNPNWVYSCRYMLVYLETLFACMLLCFILAFALAIIAKFSPNIVQVVVIIAVIAVVKFPGLYFIGQLVTRELPLEYYHSSLLWKLVFSPMPMLTKSGREDVRNGAMKRAANLRERAFAGSTRGNNASKKQLPRHYDSLWQLLKVAAESIERSDVDISAYIARLEDDLYTRVEHLVGEDIDVLSRCMPRRLAKEVHRILEEKKTAVI
jgi:hypothetical protein